MEPKKHIKIRQLRTTHCLFAFILCLAFLLLVLKKQSRASEPLKINKVKLMYFFIFLLIKFSWLIDILSDLNQFIIRVK